MSQKRFQSKKLGGGALLNMFTFTWGFMIQFDCRICFRWVGSTTITYRRMPGLAVLDGSAATSSGKRPCLSAGTTAGKAGEATKCH